MNLKDMVATQIAFDKSHGFPIDFNSQAAKYAQISKDLIGLIGEVGEFSNVVKKVTLHLERPSVYQLSMDDAEAHLKEELVDTFIYLVRLSAILGVDIESEYVKKLSLNKRRYEALK